jgi:hypothetical protein
MASEPRQLAVGACSQLTWTAFTVLHVRVASGRIFRFHVGSLVDTADVHPHRPVPLPPGETLRERFSLLPLVQFQGMSDQDSALYEAPPGPAGLSEPSFGREVREPACDR